MNYQEMTFSAMLSSLKRHWKIWLMTIILFALLGGAVALLFAGRDVSAAGTAEELEPVDLTELEEDGEYYTAWLGLLQKKQTELDGYTTALFGEQTLTEVQSKAVMAFSKKLARYQKITLQPIQEELSVSDALLIPAGYMDRMRQILEREERSIQQQILISEAAVDLLKGIEAPRSEQETVTAEYGKLLSQASCLGEERVQLETCQEKLARLRENEAEVLADGQDMERLLEEAQAEQEALMEQLHQLAGGICEENYVNAQLKTDQAGQTAVTLTHTHGSASSRESALILFLFTTLVGVCAGAFFAVCADFFGKRKGKTAAG